MPLLSPLEKKWLDTYNFTKYYHRAWFKRRNKEPYIDLARALFTVARDQMKQHGHPAPDQVRLYEWLSKALLMYRPFLKVVNYKFPSNAAMLLPKAAERFPLCQHWLRHPPCGN